jgi:predicted hydrocarbon binding protein
LTMYVLDENMTPTVQEELHIEKGEIHLGQGKERYILIPMRAYAEIVNTVFDLVGAAAGGPLYYLGKRIGYGLVEELVHRMEEADEAKNIGNLILEYAKFLEELGFGKIDIVEFNDKHAVIRMMSPPSMAAAKLVNGATEKLIQEGKRVCYLETGMIAGVFEKILGGKFQGIEKEHGSLDDPYCVIEVKRVA